MLLLLLQTCQIVRLVVIQYALYGAFTYLHRVNVLSLILLWLLLLRLGVVLMVTVRMGLRNSTVCVLVGTGQVDLQARLIDPCRNLGNVAVLTLLLRRQLLLQWLLLWIRRYGFRVLPLHGRRRHGCSGCLQHRLCYLSAFYLLHHNGRLFCIPRLHGHWVLVSPCSWAPWTSSCLLGDHWGVALWCGRGTRAVTGQWGRRVHLSPCNHHCAISLLLLKLILFTGIKRRLLRFAGQHILVGRRWVPVFRTLTSRP